MIKNSFTALLLFFLVALLSPSINAEDPPKKDKDDVKILKSESPIIEITNTMSTMDFNMGIYIVYLLDENGYVLDAFIIYLDEDGSLPDFSGYRIALQELTPNYLSNSIFQ